MVRPDLHLHTNASDGVFSPELMLHECRMAGLTHMSVTDHDTFAGSDQVMSMGGDGLTIIPGVELSISDMHSLHLLGYGTAGDSPIREKVLDLAQKREERARRIVERLESMGMPLDFRDMMRRRRLTGGGGATFGRPHIARAMVHAGYVRNMQEAFEKYLGNGKCAYVPCERLNMQQALELLRASGFVSVVAHPVELNLEESVLRSLLSKWKDLGLMGVEVYHPSAQSWGFERLDRIARSMGFLVTGGSDFHQENDPKHARIGSTAAVWNQSERDIELLLQSID